MSSRVKYDDEDVIPSPQARNLVPRAPPRSTTSFLLSVRRNDPCTRSQDSVPWQEHSVMLNPQVKYLVGRERLRR